MRRGTQPVDPCDQTITYERLSEALPAADWLILCCPASPQTRGLANAAAFAAMPRGAHLVNVARGEVAVEGDIILALTAGQLAGAYLDVFEREPLDPASPLWDMPNVIISPHTAGHSQGQAEAVLDILLDNLQRWCAGRKLRNEWTTSAEPMFVWAAAPRAPGRPPYFAGRDLARAAYFLAFSCASR